MIRQLRILLLVFVTSTPLLLAKFISPVNSQDFEKTSIFYNKKKGSPFGEKMDYLIPSITSNSVILLNNLSNTDSISLISADGRVVDFDIQKYSKVNWVLCVSNFDSISLDRELILTIKKNSLLSSWTVPNDPIELIDLKSYLEREQVYLFVRGWLVGSTLLLFFVAFIFAFRLKNQLIVKFTNFVGVVFLLFLFTYSELLPVPVKYFNTALLVINTLYLIAAFKYNIYVRGLKKGIPNYSLSIDWKFILLFFLALISLQLIWMDYVWVGLIVLLIQVLFFLTILVLNILDSFYFKWYNQMMIIVLGLTQIFFILSQYFNDFQMGIKIGGLLNLELILASFLAAKVVLNENQENRSLNRHNLQMQVQLGMIHLDSLENERKRVFQELNDDILFRLNQLKSKLNTNENNSILDSQNKDIVPITFFQELDKLLKRLRKYTYQLFPPHMSQLSLQDVFNRELGLTADLSQIQNWKLNWNSNFYSEYLPFEVKIILYRIFQLYTSQFKTVLVSPEIIVMLHQENGQIKFDLSSNIAIEENIDQFVILNRLDLYIRILKSSFQRYPSKNMWSFSFELNLNNN